MATIFFERSAERDLESLPRTATEALRDEHMPRIAENSRVGKLLHGPLRKYSSYDFWSEGVSYRIAYEVSKSNVIIIMIDTRDNFYKKFSRRVL